MEEFKKKNAVDTDKEIVFSKAIKAGKRIYYLDVKKNRKDEMFIAITESKKVVSGMGEDSQVCFEKHKIFLHKEDFENFVNGLNDTIGYIAQEQGIHSIKNTENQEDDSQENLPENNEIKIDIDF